MRYAARSNAGSCEHLLHSRTSPTIRGCFALLAAERNAKHRFTQKKLFKKPRPLPGSEGDFGRYRQEKSCGLGKIIFPGVTRIVDRFAFVMQGEIVSCPRSCAVVRPASDAPTHGRRWERSLIPQFPDNSHKKTLRVGFAERREADRNSVILWGKEIDRVLMARGFWPVPRDLISKRINSRLDNSQPF
jgi:hypothetical protein